MTLEQFTFKATRGRLQDYGDPDAVLKVLLLDETVIDNEDELVVKVADIEASEITGGTYARTGLTGVSWDTSPEVPLLRADDVTVAGLDVPGPAPLVRFAVAYCHDHPDPDRIGDLVAGIVATPFTVVGALPVEWPGGVMASIEEGEGAGVVASAVLPLAIDEAGELTLKTGPGLTVNEDGELEATDVAGVSSLPDQTGNDGKVLRTDGTDAQWANLGLVIADAPSKVTPGDSDKFALSDSDDSDVVKRIAFADLAAALASGGTGALPSTTGQTGKVLVVDPDEEPAWHFVQSDAVPQPLGTAAAGTGTGMARDDHVHEMPTASDVGADTAGASAAAQAAAEAYTDAQLAAATMGWSWKSPVKAVATSDITLSGAQTIDGVSVVAGDRVLVAGQTTGSQNGIYTAASGSWARSTDADTSAEVKAGLAVAAWAGTANGDAVWLLTTDDPITLGTTALAFSKVPMTAGIPLAYLDTDGALAANSDTKVPSQKAVKTYVDGRRLDQAATPTGDVGLGTHKITGLAAGTADTDAANVSQTHKRQALITDSATRFTNTDQGTPLSPMEASGVNTTAVTAGQLYWWAFDTAEPGTITSFQFSVTATALSAGQTVDVAMFDIAADNGPGARLWTQTVTVGNTTGIKRLTSLTLTRPTRGALAFLNPSTNAGSVTVVMAVPAATPMWALGTYTANRTGMIRTGISSMPSDLTSSNFTPSGSDALTQAVPLILGRA